MSNATVIKQAFDSFENQIIRTTRMRLFRWCRSILEAAVIAREKNPEAHDFTGNLLNSIVVCLYEKGEPYEPFFASDLGIAPAIRPKMRILRSKEKRYAFKPDYSGSFSVYKPTIDTNGGWGRTDAENFFASYKPQGNNMFDIVVAYTVEYASWVDQQRKTSGILETKKFAERTGVTFMYLKAA